MSKVPVHPDPRLLMAMSELHSAQGYVEGLQIGCQWKDAKPIDAETLQVIADRIARAIAWLSRPDVEVEAR